MSNPWLAVLKNLPLEREEKEILKRFEKDPEGRSFLAAAEILKGHRKIDECLELLSFGLSRHPGFTIARIVLVRELFHKGLIAEAARVLQESQSDISDNILALKLGFRIYALLNHYAEARNSLIGLKALNGVDTETKRFADAFELQSPTIAADLIRKHLEQLGVLVVLPAGSRSDDAFSLLPEKIDLPPLTTSDIDDLLIKNFTLDSYDEEKLSGFHAARLAEIFVGEPTTSGNWREDAPPQAIDSLTLVDIYAKQGHFRKATIMLKRLISAHPSNDQLKSKMRDLMLKEKSSAATQGESFDVMKDLETMHLIDKQIEFYEGLLNRLPHEKRS